MFSSCKKASTILLSSYEETALISGISDIVVVQWEEGHYKTSPFLVCFGSLTHQVRNGSIKILVNDKEVDQEEFSVNEYGYL